LLLVFAGCATGTLISMLPGLSPITAIALMIPITYGFDPASGMILLAGVYYGAIFGGIMFFSLMGVDLVSFNIFDIQMMVFIAVIAVVLRLLGFILGACWRTTYAELSRSVMVSSVFFGSVRPCSPP
jgi:TctA family transporter